MIIDIFTHIRAPENMFGLEGVSESSTFFYEQNNLKYLEELKERKQESKLAIELLSEHCIELLDIPADRQFITYPKSGYVDRPDEERLRSILKGITQNDRFRIHGAFYGTCASETAVQIYYLTHLNHLLHPTDNDYKDRIKEIREKKVLETSNVSFGVVYKHYKPLEDELLQIAKQLEKSHTKIFEWR